MKGLLGKLYSMHGHTIDDYLRKERAKKLILNRYKEYAKRCWPAMMLSSPGALLLLSHQTSLRRLATYSAYLAANKDIFGVYSDRQSALLDFIKNGCCLYDIDDLHFVDADVITYKRIEEDTNENE